MKRSWKISIILVTVIGIAAILTLIRAYDVYTAEKSRKCAMIDTAKYNGRDYSLITCYGNIVVARINPSLNKINYFIKDDKNGYTIASMPDANKYRVIGGQIFVKDYSPVRSINRRHDRDFYDKAVYTGTEMKIFEFDNIENIPTYNVLNIETSKLTVYSKYSEMPAFTKAIFEELENSK